MKDFHLCGWLLSYDLSKISAKLAVSLKHNIIFAKFLDIQKRCYFGITTDKDLKFDDHVNGLYKKAYPKLNALARLTPYMDVEKRRIIMKAFIDTQFGYYLLL